MTLENALENAGLEAEIDFILQHYTDGEDGRKRTNAIINLPKGRKLIIDSKNLMGWEYRRTCEASAHGFCEHPSWGAPA
jgi:DNA anti-recombination protein RmuC